VLRTIRRSRSSSRSFTHRRLKPSTGSRLDKVLRSAMDSRRRVSRDAVNSCTLDNSVPAVDTPEMRCRRSRDRFRR
jgi:hypothetical protein